MSGGIFVIWVAESFSSTRPVLKVCSGFQGRFGLTSDRFHEGHLADWIGGYLGRKLACGQC